VTNPQPAKDGTGGLMIEALLILGGLVVVAYVIWFIIMLNL